MLNDMTKLVLGLTTAALLAVLCESFPLRAQDPYHGGALDAHQHGYEHGYKDGFSFGQNSQVSNRDQDIVNQRLRAADKDYQPAFGSKEQYRQGYTDGFREGMEDSRGGKRSRLEELFRARDPNFNPDRNRDDRIDGIYPQNHWPAAHVASDIGYRDGLSEGVRDRQDGRNSQPRKHDAWRTALHGYDKDSGPRGKYIAAYRAAFELGYRDGFGGRGR
jgi:hypothetical protein